MSVDVLLAEPDPAERKKALRVLRGIKLAVLETTGDIVAEVRAHRPTLVLLDLKLPGIRGSNAIKQIRAAAHGVLIMVLVPPGDRGLQKALDQGASEFVHKPLDSFELAYRCQATLERKSSGQYPLQDPETGRFDAARIADYLDIPLRRLAATLGKSYKAMHKSPATSELQKSLEPLARSIALLTKFYATRSDVLAWLHTPHPELGGKSAMHFIEAGKPEIVRDMLESAYAGTPS